MKYFFTSFCVLALALGMNGQNINWQTGSGDPCAGTGNGTSNATSDGACITIVDLCRGTGINSANGNDFNSNGFDTSNSSCADAIADDDCLTFGFDLASGCDIAVGATLEFQLDRSGTGPPNYCLDVDDGSGYSNISSGSVSDPAGCISETLPAFSGPATVTFRLCAWGASGSSGTMDIEDGVSSCGGTDGGILLMSTVLPVKFQSFTAVRANDQVALRWKTIEEINNDYYSIERSTDGVHFFSIGKVEGHGNSYQENGYEFYDDAPLSGISYYRLKQVDYSGSFSYSKINTIDWIRTTGDIRITSMASTNQVEITGLDYGQVAIYDFNGRLIRQEAFKDITIIDIAELESGMYIFNVWNDQVSTSKKLYVR